jgi:murein DD-endopeptidase MepM/ murein hydrolase activator NlpD
MKSAGRSATVGWRIGAACALSLGMSGLAAAETSSVKPERARPGDAVLVTLGQYETKAAGPDERPRVTVGAGSRKTALWPVKSGWQGVVAIPEDTPAGAIAIRAAAPWQLDASVVVREREPRQTEVQVDDRFIHPSAEEQRWNEADREAVGRAFASPTEAPLFTRGFRWPRSGRVTSRFAERRRFNGTLDSVHEGIDLPAPTGAPVQAANDGLVVLRRDCFNSGQTIFIDHGGGIFTGYFHLSAMQVSEGDRVRRGQRIGRVGNTGRSSGPHLHFAVRADGRYVDPESFMKLRLERPVGSPRPSHASRSGN